MIEIKNKTLQVSIYNIYTVKYSSSLCFAGRWYEGLGADNEHKLIKKNEFEIIRKYIFLICGAHYRHQTSLPAP